MPNNNFLKIWNLPVKGDYYLRVVDDWKLRLEKGIPISVSRRGNLLPLRPIGEIASDMVSYVVRFIPYRDMRGKFLGVELDLDPFQFSLEGLGMFIFEKCEVMVSLEGIYHDHEYIPFDQIRNYRP